MKNEWSRRELYAHGEPFGECATRRKLGGGYVCGGGGKGSAPAAPDYTAAAQAQGESSKEVTNTQTWANRPNQNTPFGSINWQAGATLDPATGQPVTNWTQNYNLNPTSQRALDSQMAVQQGRSDLAQGFMGRVQNEYAQPFNWGGLPARGGNVQSAEFQRLDSAAPRLQTGVQQQGVQNRVNFDDNPALQGANPQERQRIENALFDRMSPIHERQQSSLDTKLANQGITMGSEAYNREMQRIGDQQSRERFNALEMGGAEMARMNQMALSNRQQMTQEDLAAANLYNQANNQSFNQSLQAGQFGNTAMQNQQGLDQNRAAFNNQVGQNQFAQQMQQSQYQNQLRNAALAEEMQRRSMSLNEMNALLTGQQVGMQQMPQFNASAAAQPVQYNQAAQNQYQAGMDAFNAQNQSANSFTSGLFGLGGSLGAASIMSFSDSRLKKIIKRVGEIKGVPLYLFKYLGSETEHIGPIAQEVQKIHPSMVKRHQNGYLMVNYTALEA
jgi:Chaperone of endosialidase